MIAGGAEVTPGPKQVERAGPETRVSPEAELLITAREAYPAFERLVLGAQERVNMGFRIFDLRTLLRSEEARAVGRTWADLLAHVLARGVDVRLVLTDFDPVGAPSLHRGTWRTLRQFAGLRELADSPGMGRLTIIPARHPARIGAIAATLFWAVAAMKLRQAVLMLNELAHDARRRFLSEVPLLRPHLTDPEPKEGRVRPRWFKGFVMTPVTHHQKIAVVDGKALYIGGLDLNERRWDGPGIDQPARQTWHDVQMLFREPALAAAGERHLNRFLRQSARKAEEEPEGLPDSAPQTAGLRLLTTISMPSRAAPLRFSPKNLSNGLYCAHVAHGAQARRMIYLETQYFRDRRLTRELIRFKEENPGLKLFIVLPAAPEEVAFASGGPDSRFGEFLQARCLRKLKRAYGDHCFVASPAQRRRARDPDHELGPEAVGTPDGAGREKGGVGRAALYGAPLIYVHAKVSIFDENAAIVSSANLNGRSLWWDTEAGVEVTRSEVVARMRARIQAHWFPDVSEEMRAGMSNLETAYESLVTAVVRDCKREPKERRGHLLPYDVRPASRFGRSVPGIPEEMV